MQQESRAVSVEVCPNGPLLVRGADHVVADDRRHDVQRPVVALCRCGGSSLLPFCDATHKLLNGKPGD